MDIVMKADQPETAPADQLLAAEPSRTEWSMEVDEAKASQIAKREQQP